MSKSFIRQDGVKVVRFPLKTDPTNPRKYARGTIYIPTKVSKSDADIIASHINELALCRISGSAISPKIANWLADCPDWMTKHLAKNNLINPRKLDAPTVFTLGKLIEQYVGKKCGVKDSTKSTFKYPREALLEYFGADKLLDSFNTADADEFREWYRSHDGKTKKGKKKKITHSPAYTNRCCKHARTFFRYAVRKNYIKVNPFGELKGLNSQSNPSRKSYIEDERISRVMNFCPDDEFRLIIALARYGTMRCPSEVLNLTWKDIDWKTQRINFSTPKTAYISGKNRREIPLFPTLRPYLDKLKNGRNSGFVISSYQGWRNTKLRERLEEIMGLAGVTPWKKGFNNLRASCRQDLRRKYKLDPFTINTWMGHSDAIGNEHYDAMLEDDFAAVVGGNLYQNLYQHPLTQTHSGQFGTIDYHENPVIFAQSPEMVSFDFVPGG